MKFILLLFLSISTTNLMSQISVSELIKIQKMNSDQFESYALNRGYELEEVEDNDNVNGVTFTKGVGKNTKYLSLYSTFYSSGITVVFQTSNTTEFINFKSQLSNFGFKFYKKETFTPSDENYTSQVNEYRSSQYEIHIHSIPPHDGQSIKYEISLNKLK
jgi:hypothetical protein